MTGLAASAVAVRGIQIAALAVVAGGFAFGALVARPAVRAADGAGAPALEQLDRLVLRVARPALAAFAAAAALDLWLRLAEATDRSLIDALAFGPLASLVTDTWYGNVWLGRALLAAFLAAVLATRLEASAGRHRPALRAAATLLAALLLATHPLGGHAAAAETAGLLAWQVTTAVTHALAAGVWLGALPFLAHLLAGARRTETAGEIPDGAAPSRAAAAAMVRRFSALGLAAVPVLLLAGLGNAWSLVGSFPALIGTPYGRILLGKVALLLPLLAIAASNLLRERPRLEAAAAGGSPARRQAAGVLGRLRRNAAAEACVGGAIVLLAAWLAATDPARHAEPVWPFAFRLTTAALALVPRVEQRLLVAAWIALLGLAAFLYAALFPRQRRGAFLVGAAGLAAAVLALWPMRRLLGPLLTIDAYPTTYARPTVAYHAISIENGLRLYRAHCAACHGPAGQGDGPAAAGLPVRPADLTAAHTADHTAGDLFWWLTHGIPRSGMPAFGERLTEEERWDLVNVTRALADAAAARGLTPAPVETPAIAAPDFGYTGPSGKARSLREARGRAVLVVLAARPGSEARLAQLAAAAPRLEAAGGEVAVVPLETATDVAAAYGLLRRRGSSAHVELPGPRPPSPGDSRAEHVELLVDRQGYVRARWSPGEPGGWDDVERLVALVGRLAAEPPRVPPADPHVH